MLIHGVSNAHCGGRKKTVAEPSAGVRKTDPEPLAFAYEDLRRQAAECSSSGGLGMAIFLDQGMVAWMLACSWVASTHPNNLQRCPSTVAPVPDDLRGEMVLVGPGTIDGVSTISCWRCP